MKSKVHPRYKTKYRVANWAAYNQALVRRGDVTVWVSSEAIAAWTPRRSGRRGGQRRYSDLAIETALTLRLLYHLPLRQAEGFLHALFGMMRLDLSAPDYTTLSRRSQHLRRRLRPVPTDEGIHLVLDSTPPGPDDGAPPVRRPACRPASSTRISPSPGNPHTHLRVPKLKISSGASVFRRQLSSRTDQPTRQAGPQLQRPAVTASSSTSRSSGVVVLVIFSLFSHCYMVTYPTQLVMAPSPFPSQRPNSSWTIAGPAPSS